MFPWKEFLGMLANGFLVSLLSPLLWIIMGLIGWRYYRLAQERNRLTGYEGWQTWRFVLKGIGFGLLGGWLGSLIMAFLGLTVNELGLRNLWMTALFLMMIHPRFICFSYGGALLILSSVIFGWPHINGPVLLALIGSLHLVESILIGLTGQNGALPVWVRHKMTNEWVIAYRMEHFWPLPLLLFVAEPWAGKLKEQLAGSEVATPTWWPIFPIHQLPPDGVEWIYIIIPVVAALGYANVAVSRSPKIKSIRSGVGLFVYSLVLLLLAWLSVKFVWILPIAALFSALGHEGLIQWENRLEWRDQPMLRENGEGLRVILVQEDSLAEELGIEPGDRLISLGDYPITTSEELKEALFWSPVEFTLRWLRQGKIRESAGKFALPGAQRRLGILPLSEDLPIPSVSMELVSLGARLLNRFRKKS